MRRTKNNIPGGAKAIEDLLWPSALACRQVRTVAKKFLPGSFTSAQEDLTF